MKVVQAMISEDNPNNINCIWIGFLSIIMIFTFIGTYIAGVYLTYGFIIASYPGYDLETGCNKAYIIGYADGSSFCVYTDKMPCYNKNMNWCYLFGWFTMWLIPLTFGVIVGFLWYLYKIVLNCFSAYETAIKMMDGHEQIAEINLDMENDVQSQIQIGETINKNLVNLDDNDECDAVYLDSTEEKLSTMEEL